MAKKSKSKKIKDPFAKREAKKYEHPIPSREFILQHLHELGHPASLPQLIAAFELEGEKEQQALGYRLRAMLRDGQLLADRRRRYCLIDKLSLIAGRVIGHPDGFGFVVPDKGGDDIYLSSRQMRNVIHGDQVLAAVIGENRRGKLEGIIHEVLEHKTQQIVGRYCEEKGIRFVVPDNTRISQDIHIPEDQINSATHGQIVMVELLAQPSEHGYLIGRIIEVLGEHMAPGMEIDIALRAHDIPHIWPQTVIDAVQSIVPEVNEADLVDRTDLRDVDLVTIDGEDAKDFDDAVFCKPRPKGGWQLIVAIADVSHYVDVQSALDIEASVRGNSVYFPGRVVPMLPEVLSNQLCSLQPKVDRLCMVCDMSISATGKLTRHRFYKAVMHSKARLTYNQVAKILMDKDPAVIEQYAHVLDNLTQLHELYKVLHKARQHRGAIDFDTTETQIVFGEGKKIEQIVPVFRNDAHRLIEECMLMANVAAAKFLLESKIPGLFRVHRSPGDEKINDLRSFLGELGLSLRGGKTPKTKYYQELLDSIRERPDAHLIQTVMLRSLRQAVYSEENEGHFGLAYDAYAHFTSPIRRYPDLLLHRAIKHKLAQGEIADFDYDEEQISALGKQCSMTERRADEATRDVTDWLKCEYMMDRVGQEFPGVISSVTHFGIFVELSNIFVEGLVHVTSLKNDYYQYDPVKHRLLGERTSKSYRLGDKVNVIVARVDLDERKMDFDLVDQ